MTLIERPDASLERLLEKAPQAAEFLRALATPNRLILLCRIAQGEVSVARLHEELGFTQPGLSQQLADLRRSGLVKARKESRIVHYSLADARVEMLMGALYAMFCAPPENGDPA